MSRYVIGCAGQFMLGQTRGSDDRNEAIVACLDGPVGCEVYDSEAREWIGPTCMEEIREARAVLDQAARRRMENQPL